MLRIKSMRYSVSNLVIKSENAAKSTHQTSQFLVEWVLNYPKVETALDFGCGKLRYTQYLKLRAKYVTIVDSEVQLSRSQTIDGKKTTIIEYVGRKWPQVRAISEKRFSKDKSKYDFALCANVLSAIPQKAVRIQVLEEIRKHLRVGGQCLICTQYRNSYFSQLAQSGKGRKYQDGWIVKKGQTASFYGILPLASLKALVFQAGLKIFDSWIVGQSAYILAEKSRKKIIHWTM